MQQNLEKEGENLNKAFFVVDRAVIMVVPWEVKDTSPGVAQVS